PSPKRPPKACALPWALPSPASTSPSACTPTASWCRAIARPLPRAAAKPRCAGVSTTCAPTTDPFRFRPLPDPHPWRTEMPRLFPTLLLAALLAVPAFAQETHSFTDDLGRTVDIPTQPLRIVSLQD